MREIAGDQDPIDLFLQLEGWPSSPSGYDGGGGDGDEAALDASQLASSESYLVGFVIVNIVGLQYYQGTISGHEMVGLVREPLNQYDPNAIKVLNTRSVQVGHVDRSSARVLSPLMDSHLITVEGIVPKMSGRGNRYKISCQIHVFARMEAHDRVKMAISSGGLLLISEISPSFMLSDAAVVKEKSGNPEEKSVDEIFKLLDENLKKKGALEALEPPKEVIKSELFLHQTEGLGWLVHRENSCELPPFWEEKDGGYVNMLTNFRTDKRPEPIRGGIFADDMGLGKTLTLLSLIALDKYGPARPSTDSANIGKDDELNEEEDKHVGLSGNKSKRGRGSKKASSSRKKQKIGDTNVNDVVAKSQRALGRSSKAFGRKTTLIVCPASVFSAWVTQLAEHTKPGKLKAYLYYGERTKDANELQKHDIVLTTYNTLSNEENWSGSPMKEMDWWRVILDEAHVVKNVNAKQSRAVISLNAKRRWVVTGTPIQNNSFDLFSFMTFLRFEPLSIKSYFNSLIQRPLAQGDDKGVCRLQVLMASMSLRRLKDKGLIGLPSKRIETFFVDLSREERDVYDQMETQAKRIVRDYISEDNVRRNFTSILSVLVRLRQVCTDLALCPPELRELMPESKLEDVSNDPVLLEKMLSILKDDEDFDCPICISPPEVTVITCCAHIFCQSCILKTLKRNKPCCPLCRRSLSESDLFVAPPEASGSANSEDLTSSSSAKVTALLKLLSASRDECPTRKSVVFSQFRKMLFQLEGPLRAAGFKVLRLDGSMNARRRGRVIEEFGSTEEGGATILLASLKASCAGVTLTAASRVYLLEPWWNPAVEEQAMDRVHRIGQKEDVKIVRMIARDTIDERILELQEKKKMLARKAFIKKGTENQRDISVDDLRTLMQF